MKITLTQSQITELWPLQVEVVTASDLGKPGMAIAQLYIGTGEMVCGFVDHEYARKIQEAGKLKDLGATTLTPDDRQSMQ